MLADESSGSAIAHLSNAAIATRLSRVRGRIAEGERLLAQLRTYAQTLVLEQQHRRAARGDRDLITIRTYNGPRLLSDWPSYLTS